MAVWIWKVSGSLFRTRRGKGKVQSYPSTTFTYFNKSPTYFCRTAAMWTCGQFILRTWQQCPSAPQRGKRQLVDVLQTKWLAHNTVKQDNNSYNNFMQEKPVFQVFRCIPVYFPVSLVLLDLNDVSDDRDEDSHLMCGNKSFTTRCTD